VSGKRLLLVEDEPGLQLALSDRLSAEGYAVETAGDGNLAVTRATGEPWDIIILDVMLPGRDGFDVAKTIRQQGIQTPILMLTARTQVVDRVVGLKLGADDYLVKPFDRDEVLKRVRTVLGRARENRGETTQAGRSALESMLLDRATALPSLPIVLDRVKEILIDQGEIGIVFIDIEQFEAIEAEYGWAFFDELLCHVGAIVSAEARAHFQNAIVTCHRTGGSSFFIFHETRGQDLSEENALERISNEMRQKLIDSTKKRFAHVHGEQIGFFVGNARVDYRPQIRLERQVYAGMQTAADAVRDAEQQRKKQLTRELRDIIRRKRVTTLFQPIVRAKDSSVFGYEILTRGPAGSSFRNSDMLFTFAREAKLAWALEAIALEGALKRLRQVDLLDRKFLLNLEAEMFGESEFRIHEMVSYFSEHRGNFVFELTERAAIEDYAQFRELLDEFRAKGIEVAIDDAGSGYASLEAIAALAPDYLKITKSLVSTLAQEPIKQDLIKMLVELATKIGAKTLAEGIETYEEFETCRDLGVDLIQGYYFAHPQEELRLGDAEVVESTARMHQDELAAKRAI
jgi:EAL domain-containing protein (putative c-di-GMP-specific phosphodiesterase class I)/CheY-like chemotaxis protein